MQSLGFTFLLGQRFEDEQLADIVKQPGGKCLVLHNAEIQVL